MAGCTDVEAVTLEGVRLVVGGRLLLELKRWALPASRRVLVCGRSGSGKTSFLQMLAGLLRPASGRVLVAGQDINELPEARRDVSRGRTIGFVFQTLQLVRALSVLDNLRLAAFLVGNRVADRRLLELLERVGLADRGGKIAQGRLWEAPMEAVLGNEVARATGLARGRPSSDRTGSRAVCCTPIIPTR